MIRRPIVTLAIVGLASLAQGCGNAPSAPPAAPAPAPTAAVPKASVAMAVASERPPAIERPAAVEDAAAKLIAPPPSKYDMRGRRDPFQPPEPERKSTGTGLTLTSAKLTGILRGGVPLALLETADGLGYIVKPGDTFAEGRLLEIGRDSAVFAVAPRPGSTTTRVVLKITAD